LEVNPVEWLTWVYGKWFVGHAWRGYFATGALSCAVVLAILGILWLRAIDRYGDRLPKQGAATRIQPPKVAANEKSLGTAEPIEVSPKQKATRAPSTARPQHGKETGAVPPPKPSPGSIQQSNSGGINVQLGTTGDYSPIINSPITINPQPPSRRLTQEKRDEVTPLLAQSPGKIIVWTYSDNDSMLLAKDLYDVLKAAKWEMQDSNPEPIIPGAVYPDDVVVFVHAEPNEKGALNITDPPTMSVINTLRRLNLKFDAAKSEKVPTGVVKIVVAPHPQS